jgi:dihydroorotate dehydrogenase (NAD+) catalytic subunit
VIGMGGIASGRQAADFMDAGATAVAIGTESFRDPAAGCRIAAELADLSLSRGTRPTSSTTV